VADAAKLSVTDDAPADRRIPAIRLLGLGDAKTALATLPPLLDARQATPIQLAALQTLAGLADRSVGTVILDQWKSMSPGVRREAVEALFARRERLAELLDALDSKLVTPGEIDPARLKELRSLRDGKMRRRAIRILGTESSTANDRAKAITSFRPALTLEGNSGRGRDVFVKVCATCHQAENRGVEVGPNLATITGRSPEDLLIHILDPNREVPLNYVNYTVATTDGRVVSGIIAEESSAALVLKRAEGAKDVIPRNQIEVVKSTGISLMPEGLEKGLAPQDVANLIAYLKSLQPAEAPTNGPKPPK
jgi:putative heme-binding domain-containing protein